MLLLGVGGDGATGGYFSFVPEKPGNSNNVRTVISSSMSIGEEHGIITAGNICQNILEGACHAWGKCMHLTIQRSYGQTLGLQLSSESQFPR